MSIEEGASSLSKVSVFRILLKWFLFIASYLDELWVKKEIIWSSWLSSVFSLDPPFVSPAGLMTCRQTAWLGL